MKQKKSDQQIVAENNLLLAQYGFYAHYLWPPVNGYVNYHTHGLFITKKHLDLQIVLSLEQKLAHGIFWTFVQHINAGETFEPNRFVSGIVKDYPLKLILAEETNREVIRIILPDPQGRFVEQGCDPVFAGQERYKT